MTSLKLPTILSEHLHKLRFEPCFSHSMSYRFVENECILLPNLVKIEHFINFEGKINDIEFAIDCFSIEIFVFFSSENPTNEKQVKCEVRKLITVQRMQHIAHNGTFDLKLFVWQRFEWQKVVIFNKIKQIITAVSGILAKNRHRKY